MDRRAFVIVLDACGAGDLPDSGDYGDAGANTLGPGKDTITGHWELMGAITPVALRTYPHGFPAEIIEQIRDGTGRGVLCNRPYSGTAVLDDYGAEHLRTGDLIVYTSA